MGEWGLWGLHTAAEEDYRDSHHSPDSEESPHHEASRWYRQAMPTLYRGMDREFDPGYDASNSEPSGYTHWTDNPDLAQQYAGPRGHVYQYDLPDEAMGQSYIDDDGERPLYYNNDGKAGLNGVSGKEYLVYHDHDDYDPSKIKPYRKANQDEKIHTLHHEGQHRTAMPAPLPKGITFHYHPTDDTIPRELVSWDDQPQQMFSAPAAEVRHDGQYAGHLEWEPSLADDHGVELQPPTVALIKTRHDLRRHGIATALWDFAKQHEPRLEHSFSQTGEGRSWARYERSRTATSDSYSSEDQVDGSAVINGVRRLADFAHRTHPGAAAFLGMTPDEQFDHFNNHLAPLYEQTGLPIPGSGKWLDFTDAVKDHWRNTQHTARLAMPWYHVSPAEVEPQGEPTTGGGWSMPGNPLHEWRAPGAKVVRRIEPEENGDYLPLEDYQEKQSRKTLQQWRIAMAWEDYKDKIEDSHGGSGSKYSEQHGSCPYSFNGGASRYKINHGDGESFLDYGHYLDGREGGYYPKIGIQMIETHPNYRKDGVAEALMRRLIEDHPGIPINPGGMTPDGHAFHDRMLDKEPAAKDLVTAAIRLLEEIS